jgi:di/tricarboxylate transporter
MSIHIAGVLGLVAIFAIGTVRSINLGVLAIVMTFVLGAAFAGESARAMVSGFPIELFILLAGVTYLFGVAALNGTVERIVDGAAYLVRGRRRLIPWMVFAVAAAPAMAGAIGSAGVALLAPIAMRLAERCALDRRMIGLMVVHGAAAGNFSPLNVLGAIVLQAVRTGGLEMSATTLFVGNLVYNVVLGGVIVLLYGGRHVPAAGAGRAAGAADAEERGLTVRESAANGARGGADDAAVEGGRPDRLTVEQGATIAALAGVAVASLAFGLSIGLTAFAAAVLLQLFFPRPGLQAERHVAWGVVLLVCGVVTYVAALQRYGTVDAVGVGIAGLGEPLVVGLLLCYVGAVTSAFASSAGILGALIPLAVPFMALGGVGTTGLVVALAVSATVVDATPFSTVGALAVANAGEDERPHVYRGLLRWGLAMIVTAPPVTWLVFILPAS